jgi:hypothetical protein
MGAKANIFTADQDLFLASLADSAHYQMLVSWQLRLAKESFGCSLEYLENRGLKNHYGAGNCLSILNIFHNGQLDIRAPHGKRVTEGEQLVPMANEMERRFNSLVWVSVFEIFEKYVKALFGKALYQLRNETTICDKGDFHAARMGVSKREGTAPYYVEYAEYSCRRDCEPAYRFFGKNLSWDKVTYPGYWEMTWDECIAAIGFCRHRIVHTEGRLSKTCLTKLSKSQRAFVTSCLHDSMHTCEKIILPPTEMMRGLFESIGSYGWGLYVLLTDRCSMKDESDFFRPAGGGARKVQPK